MSSANVLRDEADTREYRSAVATIIGNIESATGDSLIDIAENIGTSRETVSNAKNEKASLSPIFLKRLGKHYGGSFLDPWHRLYDIQAAPLERRRLRDLLPIGLRTFTKISAARDPAGPGGTTEVPQERLGYLPDLKELHRETACQIAEIEQEYA